jgi:hypothetical protein
MAASRGLVTRDSSSGSALGSFSRARLLAHGRKYTSYRFGGATVAAVCAGARAP